MTALAKARLTPRISPTLPDYVQSQTAFPGVAASTKIYQGSIVGLNSIGYAGPASATFSNVIGLAETMPGTTGGAADNGSGSNGDITIRVRTGVFRFVNSAAGDAITAAWIGKPCFVVDDQTVAKTSNAGARPVCGIVWSVDTDGVWVQMGPGLGNTTVINPIVEITYEVIADAAAGTTTAETVIGSSRTALTVSNISWTPSGAVTASDTLYATITIKAGDGAGGSRTTLVENTTKVTGSGGTGNWTAFSRMSLGTLSSSAIAAGGIVTLTIAKASTGTQLPAGTIEIVGYRY